MACPRCKKRHQVDDESVRKCLRSNPKPQDITFRIPIKVGRRPKKRRLKHPVPAVKVWKVDADS